MGFVAGLANITGWLGQMQRRIWWLWAKFAGLMFKNMFAAFIPVFVVARILVVSAVTMVNRLINLGQRLQDQIDVGAVSSDVIGFLGAVGVKVLFWIEHANYLLPLEETFVILAFCMSVRLTCAVLIFYRKQIPLW